jgi:hypothetical protein
MEKKNNLKKILLGLTTTPDANWRGKIEEIKKLDLREAALFLTGINRAERKELYALLEDTPMENIWHVHLRNDMEIDELEYLVEKFHVKAFNIHPKSSNYPFEHDYSKFASMIYIENVGLLPIPEELEKVGGICVDFSHWHDKILQGDKQYMAGMETLIENFKIGCSHLSAITSVFQGYQDISFPDVIYETYSDHMSKKLTDFDYVKDYVEYLPELVSLELENSFAEQWEVKKYVEKIISQNS